MTLSELQKQVKEFDEKFGWTNDTPNQNLIHLQEELGEMARLLLGRDGYKKGEAFTEQDFGEELADTLYLTLKLANQFNINLDEEWASVGERYEAKKDG